MSYRTKYRNSINQSQSKQQQQQQQINNEHNTSKRDHRMIVHGIIGLSISVFSAAIHHSYEVEVLVLM